MAIVALHHFWTNLLMGGWLSRLRTLSSTLIHAETAVHFWLHTFLTSNLKQLSLISNASKPDHSRVNCPSIALHNLLFKILWRIFEGSRSWTKQVDTFPRTRSAVELHRNVVRKCQCISVSSSRSNA